MIQAALTYSAALDAVVVLASAAEGVAFLAARLTAGRGARLAATLAVVGVLGVAAALAANFAAGLAAVLAAGCASDGAAAAGPCIFIMVFST